jgi:hypothetical protein
MPKVVGLTLLPESFTFKEAYALLTQDQKRQMRESIVALGISKETFHRWLRQNSVPKIWQEQFRIQLNKHLNANGKELQP